MVDTTNRGLKKVERSPLKTDRPTTKRHFLEERKQEQNENVFHVSKVDLASHHTNRAEPKVAIKIGMRRPAEHIEP